MNVLKTPKCVKKTKVFKYNMAKRSREQKGNSMKMGNAKTVSPHLINGKQGIF